ILLYFCFFQAEDGIRDRNVTGVQTCALPISRRKGGHPAKRIFQAIRIAVNDELSSFEDSLEQAIDAVKVNGRISVITFHSLEDRLCKQMFQEYENKQDIHRQLQVITEECTQKIKRATRNA